MQNNLSNTTSTSHILALLDEETRKFIIFMAGNDLNLNWLLNYAKGPLEVRKAIIFSIVNAVVVDYRKREEIRRLLQKESNDLDLDDYYYALDRKLVSKPKDSPDVKPVAIVKDAAKYTHMPQLRIRTLTTLLTSLEAKLTKVHAKIASLILARDGLIHQFKLDMQPIFIQINNLALQPQFNLRLNEKQRELLYDHFWRFHADDVDNAQRLIIANDFIQAAQLDNEVPQVHRFLLHPELFMQMSKWQALRGDFGLKMSRMIDDLAGYRMQAQSLENQLRNTSSELDLLNQRTPQALQQTVAQQTPQITPEDLVRPSWTNSTAPAA